MSCPKASASPWRPCIQPESSPSTRHASLHFGSRNWKWRGAKHVHTKAGHYFLIYSVLHCCLHNKVPRIMFGFVCLLQTLLDCHASGPDLSILSICLSHPTFMAPQVSDEMRARIIVWHDEQHLSVQEITGLVGCCVQTVYIILSYHCDYNTLRDPSTCRPHGADHSLNMGDMNYISSLIDARPKIYLDEIQDELLNRRDVFISISTLSCTLHRLSMTHKHVANEALKRNELLRATWQAAYADIPAEYCVWLDKASVDDRTNQRTMGWAALGRACVCHAAFVRGQRYSVLPALTCEGMIALDIFEGSVNKE